MKKVKDKIKHTLMEKWQNSRTMKGKGVGILNPGEDCADVVFMEKGDDHVNQG